jgi:hypothetical protein
VPADPPAAGPDRALDPPAAPRPGPGRPGVAEGDVAVADGDVAVADGDVAHPAESPITAHIGATATIHPLLLFDGDRRPFGRRACSAKVDLSGQDADGGAGAAPVAPELPATDGPDDALRVSLRENMETTPTAR